MSQSALEMSDEEFLKAGAAAFENTGEQTEQSTETDDAANQTEQDPNAGSNANGAAADEGGDGQSGSAAEASAEADEPGAGTATGESADGEGTEAGTETKAGEEVADKAPKKPEAEDKAAKEKKDEPKVEDKPAEQAAAVDYKAEYEKLLAPFQANGRQMSVKSVDDAITLMQMGANYNKKMAALKPNLKLMKVLENAGYLNEADINFMVDLRNKNPDAINKLVKDSGIDPMEIDTEKASGYQPTTRTVSDREMALDEAMEPIKASKHLPELIEVVSNKWDSASKEAVFNDPTILQAINYHMELGIYPLIAEQVENERLFGRLKGMSDFDAYKHVGDAMNAAGKFNHLAQGSSQAQKETPPPVVKTVTPKSVKAEEDKLKDQRRAASSTRPAVTATPAAAKDFNPLAMSDEEFMKQVQSKFL